MGVICVLILNVTCELATRILSSGRVHGSDLFMLLCLLPSFILSFALLFLEKRWSCHTSWPQFSFYFLLFIGTVPTFKVQIEMLIDVPEVRINFHIKPTFSSVLNAPTGLAALATDDYFLSSHRHHVIPDLLGRFKRKARYGKNYRIHRDTM